MSSTSRDLEYRRNWELRSELVAIANPERRHEYGPGRSGIVKADLLDICEHLGVEFDEQPTLEAIYQRLCDLAGTEPASTAGQEWGLRRATLKALIKIAEATDE